MDRIYEALNMASFYLKQVKWKVYFTSREQNKYNFIPKYNILNNIWQAIGYYIIFTILTISYTFR